MRSKKMLDDKYKAEVAKKAKERVEKEVEIYEKTPAPDPKDMFTYTFAELTDNLKEQLKDFE